MNESTRANLHSFFAKLESDLSLDLAFGLADKISKSGEVVTYTDIFREYEAWQIA